MSETAFKCVDADLKSPFLGWHYNPFYGDPRITYEVGGDFAAAGIQAISGYWYLHGDGVTVTIFRDPPDPPIPITDETNRWRGICAYPSLDSFWLRPWGVDPVPDARYLQLSYELDDLLGVATPAIADQNGQVLPGMLSLASVHVVDEVTP